ncbi:MAG: DinB family protein [bacterium]
MKLTVYAEVHSDGRVMAHPYPLPGCISRGGSLEEALTGLAEQIEGYYRWLDQHQWPVADPQREWELIEVRQEEAPFQSGDAAALFPPDMIPPSDGELESYFRLMAFSRRDLLAIVDPLPEEKRKKVYKEGKRTIEAILWHIAHAEEWYVSRLGIIPELKQFDAFPGDQREYLTAVREMAIVRLRSLQPLERATVYRIPEFTNHPDEPWTLRKTLRRFLEHEREHTGNIAHFLQEME